MSALSDLERKIGYAFKDAGLLQLALTHASFPRATANNERLEFVGDRVLGLVVADLVYRHYPDDREGDLARRHTALVQQAAMVEVARQIGLLPFIRRAPGDASEVIEGDAIEALAGAIYIDGGYQAVEAVIRKLWQPMLESYKAPPIDPKSMLQEWAQGRGLPLPEYKIASRTGADHAPVFEIELAVKGQPSVTARAASKRAAEKEAATQMLRQIGEI